LIETVKNGGKGHWTEVTGGVPMPPFSPRLTDAEITRLVDWILSLKDNQ
jgi:cytochrome c